MIIALINSKGGVGKSTISVPLAIWLAIGPGMTKTHALTALKFQSVIAVIVVIFGVLLLVAIAFDPVNPTMDKPPANSQAVLIIIALLATFVLPFVELGRVIQGVRLLFRQRG